MELLPTLKAGKLVVMKGPQASNEAISTLIVELALRGQLIVLDGGNRFAAYRIMRLLRSRTADIVTTSNHITIRRAFTCYQMLAMLETTASARDPSICIDLLSSFFDENVPENEVRRLFEQCLLHLDRLSMLAPALVSIACHPLQTRPFLEELLRERCDQFIEIEAPHPVETQPGLF